jgi:hypothetical protein
MEKTKRPRVSRAEWAKRVERWKDSGLSAEEFSSELGINARTLIYWKYTLSREAAADGDVGRRRLLRLRQGTWLHPGNAPTDVRLKRLVGPVWIR